MEVYERIKELRKTHLKLSQAAFGEKLGVNRDVINNIENNRLARPEQKLSLIKLMCKEFNVNEEWILTGTEPVFVEPDTFSLDEFMKQRGATDLELQIVKACFELEPDTRKMLVEHFKSRFFNSADTTSQDDDTEKHEPTVEELEEEYKKSVLNSVPKKGFTVSNTTEDIKSKDA